MRAIDQTDVKRAGELMAAYLDDDQRGYEALLGYTMAEFDPDAVISALIALVIGTCDGFPSGTKILGETLKELRNEEEPWPTQ